MTGPRITVPQTRVELYLVSGLRHTVIANLTSVEEERLGVALDETVPPDSVELLDTTPQGGRVGESDDPVRSGSLAACPEIEVYVDLDMLTSDRWRWVISSPWTVFEARQVEEGFPAFLVA